MRLLIVEDEPFIAADLESLAEALDHTVVAVADTRIEALDVARSSPLDAALVDLKLRDGFTGVTIAEKLASEFKVPFAFVTGNPELLPPGACGAIAVVRKPFSEARIAEVLAALDGQARLARSAD